MNRKTNESIGQGRGYSGLARVLAVLALLLTAATGAWAEETPLVTIENKDYTSFTSGSKTFDDKVTVTFSKTVKNYGDNYGWYSSGTGSRLTVAGTNGYTITSCKFYTYNGPAKTGYTVEGESPSVYLYNGLVYTDDSKSVSIGSNGVTKIEVVTAKHGTYAVAMKDGVTDGDKWTAKAGQDGQYQAMPLKGVEGGTKPVELKYAGDREVKRVTMRVVPAWKGDLSKISATELESDGVTVLVKDGMTLTGTLAENYKIVIADGATVTLNGVTIDGTNDNNYAWAGITCLGDATIILADGTVNTVKGFYEEFPGIYVPDSKALEIKGGLAGTGKLTASSNGNAAGIGGGKALACGSIIIVGGTVTATGGGKAAGIGGGEAAACGSITIADGVTKVIAMKGADATNSIGEGFGGYCGAVTIGGTVYYDGSDYQNDGATYLAQDEIEYPTPVAFAANEYNEASWDGSKVVFTKKTAASTPTAVANSNTAVTWSDGWYTVAGEVTISGKVTLGADTYLILQDGAKLTINGQLDAYNNQKNLYIYGQRKGDGKLNITNSDDAINSSAVNRIDIHGGEITAVSTNSRAIVTGILNVYSGKLTGTSDGDNSSIQFCSSFDVYGGEVEGTSNATSIDFPCRGITDGGWDKTLTVYGGKVTATGNGKEGYGDFGSGFNCYVKSGTSGIKFYFSDNGTDWDEGTSYASATSVGGSDDAVATKKRYVKAE